MTDESELTDYLAQAWEFSDLIHANNYQGYFNIRNKIVAFQRGPFSNFWGGRANQQSLELELDGHVFNCTEQYYMWNKAIVFDDAITAQKILNEYDASKQKELGRQVTGFNNDTWINSGIAYNVMLKGNLAKYSTCQPLGELLKATGSLTIAEAAPWDSRWGIGVSVDDDRAFDQTTWQGHNWLGNVLMEARQTLLTNIHNE